MKGLTIRLGVFLALTGALTLAIAMQIVQFEPSDQVTLTADFEDANGVRVGDAVRISGVQVGKVTGVEVVDGRARVTMTVDADRPVPEDSTVAISWLNLIGMRQVDIDPGESPTLLTGDGRDPDFSNTSSVVDLAALADELSPFATTLDPESVNGLLETIHQALEGTGGDVGAIVRNLEVVLATLGERDEVVTQMIDDYADVTDALVARDQQFRQMLDNLVALTEAYEGTEELLGQALADTTELTVELQGFFDRNGTELASFLGDVEQFAAFAADHTEELVALLQAFPPGLESFFDVLRHGEYLRVNAFCLDVNGPPCDAEGGYQLVPTGSTLTAPGDFRTLLLGAAGGPS